MSEAAEQGRQLVLYRLGHENGTKEETTLCTMPGAEFGGGRLG
jgi:hypothetical protein